MGRAAVISSILTLVMLGVASSSAAHHPPGFERCKSLTVTGQIESVGWHNPHVELSIKSDDGTVYHVLWLNLQQMSLAGIQRDTLRIGDRVVVTAGVQGKDGARAPLPLSEILRPIDGWQWAHPAEGC